MDVNKIIINTSEGEKVLVDLTGVQWLIMLALSLGSLILFEITKFLRPLIRQLAGLPEA